MKTQPIRRSHGFTLVELLVVIAIIAVLAGAGFAAGNAAIQKARKTTALAACVAIESAVNNFYSEYGTMPYEGLTTDKKLDTEDTKLLNVLLGTEGATVASPLNPRAIKFLSVREGKKTAGGGTGGLIYSSGTTIRGIYDPWGGKYNVMLDGDYDEAVKGVKPKGTGATTIDLNGKRVAAWSDGADGITSTGKAADDVTTWK